MRSHLAIVAWLHLILDGSVLLLGTVALIFFGGLGAIVSPSGPHQASGLAVLLILVGSALLMLAFVTSVPGLIAGWGLLQGEPWARTLMIVISIIDIIRWPGIGLIVGVYGLVVLFSPDVTAYFNRTKLSTQ